jgi:glutamyl-tRNA synthetase
MKDEQGRDVEKFDQEFLRQHFSIERIGKTNSKFDRVKLASFNQDALAAMTDEQFMHALLEWCKAFEPSIPARLGPARMLALAKATRTRVKTISEAVVPGGPGHFAVIADDAVQYDPPTVETILKKSDPATGQSGFDILRALEPIFASMDLMTPESVEAAIKSFCEARPGADGKPLGVGKVAQPLRVALTGAGVSPALGDTCAMLGTPSVLARLKRCLSLA